MSDVVFEAKNDRKKANISISIRFNQDIYERLKNYEKANEVSSFNSLVIQCCTFAMDHAKQTYDEPDKDITDKSE